MVSVGLFNLIHQTGAGPVAKAGSALQRSRPVDLRHEIAILFL